MLVFVTSCVTVGGSTKHCGPNDTAIRLTEQQIEELSPEQARQILQKNEALVKKGCAVPNG